MVMRRLHLELDAEDAQLLDALCRVDERPAAIVLRRALRYWACAGPWIEATREERDRILREAAASRKSAKKGGK